VKLSKDKKTIYFTCSLKNAWDGNDMGCLKVGSICDFYKVYIEDEYIKKGRVIADKVLRDKYGDNFRYIVSKNYYDNLSEIERYELTCKIKNGLRESGYNHKSFLGKKHKEESKQKIGLSNSTHQKGENNSQYGTCWITNGTENKKIKKTDILPENWWYGRIR
jgi:hypothetical protein